MQIWNSANVSPQDWVQILQLELKLARQKNGLNDCCRWLAEKGFTIQLSTLSRLKAVERCDKRLSHLQEEALETIIQNISVRTCIIYFENLAYRAYKFFLPNGNSERRTDPQSLPLGVYQATRYSFAYPNKLLRSAFLFYKNPEHYELLAGYGDGPNAASKAHTSNVLRFKEIRHLYQDDTLIYQILVGGFVFSDKNSFALIGAAIETEPNVVEHQMTMSDIRRVHFSHYVLDDDGDSDFIRGIKVTSLKNEHDPAAAVIELNRIPSTNVKDWENIVSDPRVEIGLNNADEPSLQKYKEQLSPENNQSDTFHMMRVRRQIYPSK